MRRFVEKNENSKYKVGEKIRKRREELGLSQDKLADIVGTSRQMVSRYENGDQEMGIASFLQYADALETEPGNLLPSKKKAVPEKKAQLIAAIEGLADEDLDILIVMAARLKNDL